MKQLDFLDKIASYKLIVQATGSMRFYLLLYKFDGVNENPAPEFTITVKYTFDNGYFDKDIIINELAKRVLATHSANTTIAYEHKSIEGYSVTTAASKKPWMLPHYKTMLSLMSSDIQIINGV